MNCTQINRNKENNTSKSSYFLGGGGGERDRAVSLIVSPTITTSTTTGSSSSTTTTTAVIKATIQFGVCHLVYLPSSLAIALSFTRPHCTELVVYTGSSSTTSSTITSSTSTSSFNVVLSSLAVGVGIGAMQLEEKDVLVVEGGIVMVSNPVEARALLGVRGRDYTIVSLP